MLSAVRPRLRQPRECRFCGASFEAKSFDTSTCVRHRWARSEVLVDRTTPYEEDLAARLFVRTFHDGAPLEAIGEAMGISRERVRQIQDEAFEKLLGTHRSWILSMLRHDPLEGAEAIAMM